MWSLVGFLVIFINCANSYVSPNYFCADMNPQQHVNVEQTMGMWYGIEILNHNDEGHYVQIVQSCPILHLSQDKNFRTTTYNPLYNNVDYGHNYGEKRIPYNYNYNNQRETTTKNPYDNARYDNYYKKRYGTKNQNGKGYNVDDLMRGLRIWWDENGKETEYHLKYNLTQPGFWISSGPQNGSQLEPIYSNFAGTVQVIKAVGNHMALTFCHQLPEKQLFTIILSRQNRLDKADIYNVHGLLSRRDLSTSAIQKVCWNSSDIVQIPSLSILFILIFSIFLGK